jgi:O-antigen ligase
VFALAALTGPLPKAGVVVVVGLAAAALLGRDDRQQAVATLGALVLSPLLLAAEIWHSPQLHFVHRHPLVAVALAVVALAVVGGLALVIDRWPAVLGLLAVAALPFRITIHSGGTTSNLLVPLYLVIGAGSLAFAVRALRGADGERGSDGDSAERSGDWIARLLALYLMLYAVQALYSGGFEKALQNAVFFYVPFALLYRLLIRLEWTPRLIRACVWLLAAMAVVFAGVAFFEYATSTTLFSTRLAEKNQLYVYFVANSVFFDPNIFGRFLALVMVAFAVALLYDRPPREQLAAIAVLALSWGALVTSFSRSSMIALLIGLAFLAAIRWKPGAPLAVGAVVVVVGAAAIAVSPTTFGLNQGLNGVSSGRGSVLAGGLRLFEDRPAWGFGSGSFEREYRLRNPQPSLTAASHTIPITVAAEQGVIGELAYVSLVVVAFAVLIRGARADPVRAAVAAAFAALVVHTMLYADFLEDPFTWALLGIGAALARARAPSSALLAHRTKIAIPPARTSPASSTTPA